MPYSSQHQCKTHICSPDIHRQDTHVCTNKIIKKLNKIKVVNELKQRDKSKNLLKKVTLIIVRNALSQSRLCIKYFLKPET